MRIHYIVIFTIVSFLSFQSVLSQHSFPESWEGRYQGELQIYGVDSIKMTVAMSLNIAKQTNSVYQWKIGYDFNGKSDIRNYELKIVDVKKGHYVIDEKNSIVIDSYYKMGTFTSFFEVMDSYIISTYTRQNEDIIFEIIAGDGKTKHRTGDRTFEGEKIPAVTSFLVNGRQKAVLKKY